MEINIENALKYGLDTMFADFKYTTRDCGDYSESIEADSDITIVSSFVSNYTKMTDIQKKLTIFVMGLVKKDDDQNKEYFLGEEEIESQFGVGIRRVYDECEINLTIEKSGDDKKSFPLNLKSTYDPEEKKISFVVNSFARQYLLRVRKQVDSLFIEHLPMMSNLHFTKLAYMIYSEWFVQIKKHIKKSVERNVPVEDIVSEILSSPVNVRLDLKNLRQMLFGEERKYDKYNNFKRIILVPFSEDLKSKSFFCSTDLLESKQGRKVEAVVFALDYTEKGREEIPSIVSEMMDKSKG